jgi:ferredoxin-thioredoxin reductase catalytic subunit
MKVRIKKEGSRLNGERGVIEELTDHDIALVRTYGGRLVPCFYYEVEGI